MKKFLSLRNILICIAFTVFLLLVKDNMDVVWSIFGTIASVLTPFAIGFLLAYILNFPYKFFYEKAFSKMGKKRKFFANFKKPLSILCTYTIVIAVVVVIIAIVVPQIVVNIASLVQDLPVYFKAFMANASGAVDFLNDKFNIAINLESEISNIINKMTKYMSVENLTKVLEMIMSAAGGIYNFVMGVIISVYFLASKESLCRQVKKLAVGFIPIRYLPKIYEIVDIADTKCGRFLVGDILDAAFLGFITFLAMSVLGIPYAPLIAVLVGVTNIIPFFGPFIGAIPSAFILLIVDPIQMIKFIILIFFIQQIDGNVIKPKIIGSQVGLSSFWVLFSVVVGGALFGVIGLILGTPIYAVIYALVSKKVKNNIKDKGKIAQEALDFEVLNYVKIAEEQKRIREEKEHHQRELLKKFIGIDKHQEKSDNAESWPSSVLKSSDSGDDDASDSRKDSNK